jgi:hypothetical protein
VPAQRVIMQWFEAWMQVARYLRRYLVLNQPPTWLGLFFESRLSDSVCYQLLLL